MKCDNCIYDKAWGRTPSIIECQRRKATNTMAFCKYFKDVREDDNTTTTNKEEDWIANNPNGNAARTHNPVAAQDWLFGDWFEE